MNPPRQDDQATVFERRVRAGLAVLAVAGAMGAPWYAQANAVPWLVAILLLVGVGLLASLWHRSRVAAASALPEAGTHDTGDSVADAHAVAHAALLHEVESLRGVQRELVAARRTAEAATMAKGEFLATMSHEIRTPLNGILPLLDLLLATELAVDQRDYAMTAYQSAQELLRIVDDILDYSKIEANKLELESVGINLRELVESVTRLLQRNAEAKGLFLRTTIAPGVRLALRGDPLRLRQILTNLVSNAIKFTHHGGVAIEVQRLRQTRTHDRIRFAVRDTGIGISQEARQHLFHPFAQADASTTRAFGGTGLGLVICKRLVETMDGHIDVESEPGSGSLFWFSVPLLKAPGDIRAPLELGGVRALLLAPDNDPTRRLNVALRQWGLSPMQTGLAADALAKLRSAAPGGVRSQFRLLIVDVATFQAVLPPLLRHLLNEPALAALRIVFLTDDGTVPTAFANEPRLRAIPRDGSGQALRHAVDALLDPGYDDTGDLPAALQAFASTPEPIVDTAQTSAPTPATCVLRGRVLLVEDNPVNRLVAQRLLASLGLNLAIAEDGARALERIASEAFDLVLMDCQMPIMDGYTATREQRERERRGALPHLPIVAMTANAMPGDREKCLAAGMDEYLSKPLERGLLARTLQRWLDAAAPSGQPEPSVFAPSTAPVQSAFAPSSAGCVSVADATEATRDPVRAESPSTPLDHDVLRDLLDVMGASFGELVHAYLDDAPKHLATLSDASARADHSRVANAAHSLKSTSANLGALALAEHVRQIEHAARNGVSHTVAATITNAHDEFGRVAAALRKLAETPVG